MTEEQYKIVTNLTSAFFGFGFGLLALRIKELRDRRDMAVGFLIQLDLFIEQLAIHLTEVRSHVPWLKADAVFASGVAINALVVVKEDVNAFVADLRKILVTYSQWERGHFLDAGIRVRETSQVRAELVTIQNRARKMIARLSVRALSRRLRDDIDPAQLWWR